MHWVAGSVKIILPTIPFLPAVRFPSGVGILVINMKVDALKYVHIIIVFA